VTLGELSCNCCAASCRFAELKSLSEATGCVILGKAEHLNPGLSVKDRAAAGMLAAAEATGKLTPHSGSGTIIEATGGNTGVSLALMAASRGYTCILTMPDRISAEKKATMRLFGAQVIECPSVPFSDSRHFYHAAARLAKENPSAVWLDQFFNDANWRAHYCGTGPEMWSQAGHALDAVALASGTGGTIGGLSSYLKEVSPSIAVFLVDPPGSGLKGLLEQGRFVPTPGSTITEGIGTGRHTLNFDVARPHVDAAVTVRDADAVQMAHYVLRTEGVFLGPSAAMNVMGAVMAAKTLGPGHTVATVLCDGGANYRSTIYNDEFLKAHGLSGAAAAGAAGYLPDLDDALQYSAAHPGTATE